MKPRTDRSRHTVDGFAEVQRVLQKIEKTKAATAIRDAQKVSRANHPFVRTVAASAR